MDKRTYCNPLPLPDVPRGVDPWSVMAFTGESPRDYRSVSDPSVLYENGRWYLYPSYGMAYVTEDFAAWHHVRTHPYNMKYSPTVVPFRGKYLMTSHSHGLYIADDPLGDFAFLGNFIKPDGAEFCPVDPALFVDEDGRLYLYAFTMRPSSHRRAFVSGSIGVGLDGEDPRRMLSEPVTLMEFDPAHEWERFGEHNADTCCGWIEGQWMVKRGGRYYLLYASSGTEYTNYCMAAYVSDTSPLAGFRPQKHNPVTISHSRFITGAGHGCITEGPNGTLWAFYTIVVGYTHIYERLVGMDLIAVNGDGELYAPHGITDTPQYAPGVAADPVSANDTGLLPLTHRQRAMLRASTAAPGREPLYAVDSSLLTWWQPAEGDRAPSLTIDLQAPYLVSAVRLIFRDIGLDYDHGGLPGAYRYVLEGVTEPDTDTWAVLVDARDNDTDRIVDYRTFAAVSCEKVRLTILYHPVGLQMPGVIDFTVFGVRDETK